MLKDAGVTVHFHQHLLEHGGVELRGKTSGLDYHCGRKQLAGKDICRLQL